MTTTRIVVTGLTERLEEHRGQLTAAGLRVTEYIEANPDSTLFSTAVELGRRTGTSDATVVRTIKQLGYTGMDELREEIREAIERKITPVGRLQRSLDWAGAEPAEVLDHMLDLQAQLIVDTRASLSATQFAEAVELLDKAASVFVYGLGPLEHIGHYFALRLERLGVHARAGGLAGFRLADELLNLTRHDVVVLVAYSQVRREIDVVLDQAHEVGAAVLLITDTLGRALGDKVTVSLSAPAVKNLMVSSFTTPVIVADALTLAVAAHSRRRSERYFERLERLRNELNRP